MKPSLPRGLLIHKKLRAEMYLSPATEAEELPRDLSLPSSGSHLGVGAAKGQQLGVPSSFPGDETPYARWGLTLSLPKVDTTNASKTVLQKDSLK